MAIGPGIQNARAHSRRRRSFAQVWGGASAAPDRKATGDRPAGAGRLFATPSASKRRGPGCLCAGRARRLVMARARRVRMCRDCGHLTPKPTVSNTCRLCGGLL